MSSKLTSLEKSLRLRGLAKRLGVAIERCADPDAAVRLAPGVLRAAQGEGLREAWRDRPDEVCRVLANLCGGAPFFAPVLERRPDWLAALSGDRLAEERGAAEYRRRLGDTVSGCVESTDAAAAALRSFKYYELARITVRELCEDLVPLERTAEVLNELSHLADALLQQALECARARAGRDLDEPPPVERFAVIGMGKLGSEELNYSSDVDLIYVNEDSPTGRAREYYTRVAEEFGRLVRRGTEEGFLYRVDLDLRPEGNAGPLVVSATMLADYYERWAETWEKAAVMKARPVAGDLDFGWQAIRAIDPIVYRSSMDLASVEAIREMKDKIELAKGREAKTFNVKLGRGGIRDVEFVAQALQLVYGGRQPQVRQRSTQAALQALAETGALAPASAAELLEAYRFLRRIENRIQMEGERQVYRLPADEAGRRRLARAFGHRGEGGVAEFEEVLEGHRGRVRQIFAALFERRGGDRIIDLFQRNVPYLLANPATRGLVENLAEQFAGEVESSSSPERATHNLDEFIRGVGKRKFFYELLLDRPELVPRLVRLFAGSQYLSSYVATHPRLIEPLFDDPNVLLRSRAELEKSYAEIHRMLDQEGTRGEPELSLDALRLFHNRELVNVGLLDMDERIDRAAAEASLTDVAEVCVERGLELAEAEMTRRARKRPPWLRTGEFLVVAMGKLASREITYGSDLDVIFLYDVAGATEEAQLAAQSAFVSLAQKLIWALQTRTAEGVCYEIDARLRPSGNQGLLVSHVETFQSYHARQAAPWERQALLRSRPVAGSARLAEVFEGLRRRILVQPNPPDLHRELHRVRLRMEAELARESGARRDFKTGRGGLLDVETIVQYLQLGHASRHRDLLDLRTVAEQIGLLERHELLGASDALTLAQGWEFLQRLSSRLRIVENRSISDLDAERGDLDEVAKRLGYTAPGRSSGARRALLDEYGRRTAEIREVYERILQVREQPAPPPAEPATRPGPVRPQRRRLATLAAVRNRRRTKR
jgi:[glutamine synthetase] adenylyltransferase / [glutamine synthetase]-adenylyl-L-tyrosine phosphorylase